MSFLEEYKQKLVSADESKIQLEQCINKAGEEETIELLSKMETFDLDLIRQAVLPCHV